jgi:hypothetical protein
MGFYSSLLNKSNVAYGGGESSSDSSESDSDGPARK